jgi:hypothetical protein
MWLLKSRTQVGEITSQIENKGDKKQQQKTNNTDT